jgi:hypothetical protein
LQALWKGIYNFMVFPLPLNHRRVTLKADENGKSERKGQKMEKKMKKARFMLDIYRENYLL